MIGVRVVSLGLIGLIGLLVACSAGEVEQNPAEQQATLQDDRVAPNGPEGEPAFDDRSAEAGRQQVAAVDTPAHWPDRIVLGVAPVAVNQSSVHLRRLEAFLVDELGIPVVARVAGSSLGVAQDLAAGRADVIVADILDVVVAHGVDEPIVALDADPAATTEASQELAAAVTIVHQSVRSDVMAEPMVWVALAPNRWCDAPVAVPSEPIGGLQACPAIADAIAQLARNPVPVAEIVPSTIVDGGVTIFLDASSPTRERYAREHLSRLLPPDVLDDVTVDAVGTRRRMIEHLLSATDVVGILRWTTVAAIGPNLEDRALVVVGIATAVPHQVVAVRQGLPQDLVVRIAEAFGVAAATPWAAQALLDLVHVEGWAPPQSSDIATARRVADHATS